MLKTKTNKQNLIRQKISRYGKILLSSFLVLQLFFSYLGAANVASAQGILNGPLDPAKSESFNRPQYNNGVDTSIEQYLCVPSEANLGTALYSCISKIYRFGVAVGAIALVFFVVYAGYSYMAGGETGKEKGKSVFLSAITGMVIILSSYVLLGFINPELTKIKVIQPPIFSAGDLPSCEDVGLQQACVLPSGQINQGGGTPGSASEAKYASLIAKYAPRLGNTPGVNNYCTLSALIAKESSYVYNNASNAGPSGTYSSMLIDVNHANKKMYNLPFIYYGGGTSSARNIGHGIGLGQVFIYGPPSAWQSKGWIDSGTPARSSKSDFGYDHLTVTDLLDPDRNLDASSFFFAKLMKDKGGDIAAAYKAYSGGEAPFKTGADSKYNQCVLRQGK